MTAGGIDLGGTKIESRYFDATWQELARNRVPTPMSYPELVAALLEQIRWLEAQGPLDHVGVGVPGLIDPRSGRMLTANLPATGCPLATDLMSAAGRPVSVANDCRAFALSEAVQGAGRDHVSVLGLVIGTGVAGGMVVDGSLLPDLNGQHGEFGHLPLPADVVARYGLPLAQCGCGLAGCFETLLAGPGLVRLARHLIGGDYTAKAIMTGDNLKTARLAWADIAGSLVAILSRTFDPEIIVLGGGIGSLPDVPCMISTALDGKLLAGTRAPKIVTAAHGDASGARGAAILAMDTAA